MTQKTLTDTLAARESIYVNCGRPMCGRSTKLDIQALIDRLGPEHGSMHQDLVRVFGCSKCKAAGRDRRPVFFTCIPDHQAQQDERNRNWKPTFDHDKRALKPERAETHTQQRFPCEIHLLLC